MSLGDGGYQHVQSNWLVSLVCLAFSLCFCEMMTFLLEEEE